ncbi:hypothetical protein BJ508DRAFT_60327 [Ascobolus immersus RN42]|uniref:Uncharacterized protein n=1 Tax=Ascobolus immersus RN42 TaxID=1160509 RepID=A0A3N4ITE9_ASCIM|nr:hypothetical protein BJ508DRAFT_60327 [Ascobolus immersus RN42]
MTAVPLPTYLMLQSYLLPMSVHYRSKRQSRELIKKPLHLTEHYLPSAFHFTVRRALNCWKRSLEIICRGFSFVHTSCGIRGIRKCQFLLPSRRLSETLLGNLQIPLVFRLSFVPYLNLRSRALPMSNSRGIPLKLCTTLAIRYLLNRSTQPGHHNTYPTQEVLALYLYRIATTVQFPNHFIRL